MEPDGRAAVLGHARRQARSGFRSRADGDGAADWLDAYDVPATPELLAEVEAAFRAELAALEAEAATWTVPTVNDRITAAFEELRGRGIVALENAGYTTSDGWSDVAYWEAEHPGNHAGAFYHGQDLERGIDGLGLYLVFGSFTEGEHHERDSLAVAREICATLERHGVPTTWDGTLGQRISIRPFPWRRRPPR